MHKSFFEYWTMLADHVKMTSYQKAIHEVIKESDVVADIGTVSVILAFFVSQRYVE